MKHTVKLMSLLLLSLTITTMAVSCGDNAKQKEEVSAKQKEADAERQKEAELQKEKDQIILQRSREAGRKLASRDCESCFNESVRYFNTKETITPIMNQEKTKWIENDELIFRNANKYDVSSELLEKMVVEYRRGFNEGWNDMFEYLCNKR